MEDGAAKQGAGLDWQREESGKVSQGGGAPLENMCLGGPKTITHSAFFILLIIIDGFILTNVFTKVYLL